MLLCESLSFFGPRNSETSITKFSAHLDVPRCAPRGADWPRPSASVGPGGHSAGERGAALRSPPSASSPPRQPRQPRRTPVPALALGITADLRVRAAGMKKHPHVWRTDRPESPARDSPNSGDRRPSHDCEKFRSVGPVARHVFSRGSARQATLCSLSTHGLHHRARNSG